MSEKEDRMGRAEAMGVLARMATQRGRTLDEVRALQVAVRNVGKRMFDRARWCARKEAGGGVVVANPPFSTPPEVLEDLRLEAKGE